MGLKPNDSRNAYVQIADDLRRQIRDGEYAPGDKLPSTSELVARYEVANMTIQGAFRVLRDENLIYSVQGRGTFVRSDLDPAAIAEGGGGPQPSEDYQTLRDQIEALAGAVDRIEHRMDEFEKSQRRKPKAAARSKR